MQRVHRLAPEELIVHTESDDSGTQHCVQHTKAVIVPRPLVKESSAGLNQMICAAEQMDAAVVWQATTWPSQAQTAEASHRPGSLQATAEN
jgi:biotin carboxylase